MGKGRTSPSGATVKNLGSEGDGSGCRTVRPGFTFGRKEGGAGGEVMVTWAGTGQRAWRGEHMLVKCQGGRPTGLVSACPWWAVGAGVSHGG